MSFFNQYQIHNVGWFWRLTMMNQTQANTTPVIEQRSAAETLAVCALVATYLGLFTLFTWYEQYRFPYIHTESLEFYWEVIKINPFSEAGIQYTQLLLKELAPIKILPWVVFVSVPVVSSITFIIARSKLKKMPMHEASEGGKIAVLGRYLGQFIEGKSNFFMIFVIGYSFFATSAFSQWIIDFMNGRGDFNVYALFFPIMSFVLVWLFLRPIAAFYVITSHKKSV